MPRKGPSDNPGYVAGLGETPSTRAGGAGEGVSDNAHGCMASGSGEGGFTGQGAEEGVKALREDAGAVADDSGRWTHNRCDGVTKEQNQQQGGDATTDTNKPA
jgi:hypothetical protein